MIFLFFFCLSFAFWVLQSMQEEYEIVLQMPVHYKDMPRDMVFASPPPRTLAVRVRDKGSALLNYTLGQPRAVLAVSMREGRHLSGNALHLSADDLSALVAQQLIPTTRLVSFEPRQIEATCAKLQKKRLPAHFDGHIRTKPGYQISGRTLVVPSTVEVYAPAPLMSALSSAPTVYTEMANADKTITRKLKLRPIDGVTFDPDIVSVTIPIEAYTQKTLEIPITCRHVPPGYAIRMFPSVVKVTCNVPLSLFKNLSEKDFIVEASLVNPAANASGMLPLRLTLKPEGVDQVALSPDSIEFILERSQ